VTDSEQRQDALQQRQVSITIASLRRQVAAELRQLGIDSPEIDSRLILGHALGLDHAGLVTQGERILTPAETNTIAMLAQRRLAHEPVARILGHKEFWGLDFELNSETLVPRPDTETVVEAALATLDTRSPDRLTRLRLADLGTGSGALLLALLSELPQAWGIGTDVSYGALACARRNAQRLGLMERATFVACDYGRALSGRFDLVVSNPPYVCRDTIDSLSPEVSQFDPRRALDGGADGLDAYRSLAADALRLLSSGGVLVVEIGEGQHDQVIALLAAAGLTTREPRRDLAGIPRACIAIRPS
jgi:release factor glutamine methyltransferase